MTDENTKKHYLFHLAVLVVVCALFFLIGRTTADRPDCICNDAITLDAEVNGKRGDLVLEDCYGIHFFERARME